MHLEGQNSCIEDKKQKGIDIRTNHQILSGNSMEHLGGRGDNLGERTDGKYTMENQKNFEKDARQRRIQVEVHNNPLCYLSTMRRIKLALAENGVGASG